MPAPPRRLTWPNGFRRGARRSGSAGCRAPAARCSPPGSRTTQPQRLLTVVAPTPAEAERWLTDLAHLTDGPVALYPQREALGEDEPHYEIAGERAETIEALLQGTGCGSLVTTARATAERTLVPAALERLRLRLAAGERPAPKSVAAALERWDTAGCRTVTEVAEFSVRGGILDVYGFGMAVPARLEWWGDDITSIRGFDLTTQRSLEELSEVTVLPVSTPRAGRGGGRAPASTRRASDARCSSCCRRDTIVIEEAAGPDPDEVKRAWNEAEHHLEVARRLGEDVPSRDAILEQPDGLAAQRIAAFPRLLLRDEQADLQFGFFPPEKIDRDLNRLRSLLAGSPPTLILCDNEGQLERLEELLEEGGRGATRATLAIGALDGGFVMPSLRVLTDHEIFRRARRLRRPRRYRQAAPSAATGALTVGDYVVHLDHGIGIYRGIQTITVGESTLEVAIVEYEGGDRLNVPLYRLDQLERYRAAGEDGDRPPPRIHRLGGASWQRVREKTRQAIKQMAAELLDLYARRTVSGRLRLPARHQVAARARVAASSTRTRPTSARRPRRSRPTWSGRCPWTGCWWATWATARPRSRCGRRSRRCRAASRWRCWCPRPFSRSSTAAPSSSGWPISRCKIEVLSRFRTRQGAEGRARPAGGRRRPTS